MTGSRPLKPSEMRFPPGDTLSTIPGMSDDCKKPGWAFWAMVVLILPLLYALSFGPACWIWSRTAVMYSVYDVAYRPLAWLADRTPFAWSALQWYATVGMPEPSVMFLPGGDPDNPQYFTNGHIHLHFDRAPQ